MKLQLHAVALGSLMGLATVASASTYVSLLGDKDCFGLRPVGTPCPDGTLWRDQLGGVFFTNYQSGGDPSFTDKWDTGISPSYNHTYMLGGGEVITSAVLRVRTAGLADDRGPWNVYVNGNLIGQIPTNTGANAFQEVINHSFNVNTAFLNGGNESVLLDINNPGAGDGYSIDFSELTVNAAPVPEPFTLVLGAAGLAIAARRRLGRQA